MGTEGFIVGAGGGIEFSVVYAFFFETFKQIILVSITLQLLSGHFYYTIGALSHYLFIDQINWLVHHAAAGVCVLSLSLRVCSSFSFYEN